MAQRKIQRAPKWVLIAIIASNAGIYLLGAAWVIGLLDSAVVQIVAGAIIVVWVYEGISAVRELQRRARTRFEER